MPPPPCLVLMVGKDTPEALKSETLLLVVALVKVTDVAAFFKTSSKAALSDSMLAKPPSGKSLFNTRVAISLVSKIV